MSPLRSGFLALVVVAASAIAASPAVATSGNDNRAAAFTLASDGQLNIDTSGNTVEPSEPNTVTDGCASSALRKVGATEWFKVTGSGGPMTITTDEPTTGGSPVSTAISDTIVFVYPQGSNTSVACNDDISGANFHSSVTFNSTANQVYEVQVGTCCSSGALGGVMVTSLRPVNDPRSFPTPVTSGAPVSASNNFATTETSEVVSCLRANGSTANYTRTVWFKFSAPSAGTAIIRTNGGLDTVEAVYAGGATTQLACNDDLNPTAAGPSGLTVNVVAGDYFIQVGGFGAARGSFTETVDFTPAPAPPTPAPTNPTPVAPKPLTPRLGGTHSDTLSEKGGLTKFTLLYLPKVPAQTTVVFTCTSAKGAKRANRCPFKTKTIKVKKATAKLQLLKYLEKRKLAPGTKLRIKATAAARIGFTETLTTRSGKAPKYAARCFEPGSAKSQKTCS